MKSLKTKVIASAAMLLVAAVMMTSASFAWYTISTSGEAQQIKAELKATDNLEIAKAIKGEDGEIKEVKTGDSATENSWGSTVTSWGEVSQLDVPATADSGAIKTVTYANGGRVASASEMETCNPGTMADGLNYYSTADGKKAAVVYGIWLRSNNDLTDVVPTLSGNDSTTMVSVRYTPDGGSATTVKTDGTEQMSLKADTPTFVEVIAYIDGENVYAEHVDGGLSDTDIKLTFTSETISPTTP